MAIDNPDVVDLIGVDRETGRVVLTISDHLSWAAPEEHLSLLEEKIEAYAQFIQSGQLLESYPEARDREVEIKVVFKHELPDMKRLNKIHEAVQAAGLFASYERLSG